jgi:hypothetical protein
MAEKTEAQKDRDWKLVKSNLEFFSELFPDEVKRWIREKWPRVTGLDEERL